MVRVAATTSGVGTSAAERAALARQYGCDPTWLNDDLNRQTVHLPTFWIDRYPVTNGQYMAFVEAARARKPWPGGVFSVERADHPVVGVSYTEAERYARWAGKRLPSAEEWEVAAQGMMRGLYPWGNTWAGPLALAAPKKTPHWDVPATARIGSARAEQDRDGGFRRAGM